MIVDRLYQFLFVGSKGKNCWEKLFDKRNSLKNSTLHMSMSRSTDKQGLRYSWDLRRPRDSNELFFIPKNFKRIQKIPKDSKGFRACMSSHELARARISSHELPWPCIQKISKNLKNSKRFQNVLKDFKKLEKSKRFQTNPKDSKQIQKIPKDPKDRFRKSSFT